MATNKKKTAKRKTRKKATRRRAAAKSRKGFIATVASAIEEASRNALKEALGVVGHGTPVGNLLDQVADSPYLERFRDLTIGELLEAMSGASKPRRGRPPGSGSAPAKKKGKGSRKSFSTRTDSGRKKIDVAVSDFLSSAGEAGAEQIRSAVGGTSAQLRQSLDRLRKAKKVSRKGQKRGTRYTWKG
jgi:hypothetical protein